ncbi:MAG: 4Fe-4S binding protein [Methanoregulaceae archaeon]|jgi:dissimilatory sulfite reductase (desulfoviridin) alpha/beta subunit|nr:4Fe-4S binding protein [Methanoregulaceae archaeon]MCU0628313.1 4Fe-4S binding protein [Methanoregulaceae archaeon]
MLKDMGIHMKGGVITELDSEYCTIRARIPAGVISCGQLKGIAEVAERYGADSLHLTTRQTIEIPHMNPADLDAIAKDLAANNTPVGSERDEVVNVIACPGTERCIFANIDSISLARSIDAKLFGKEMPVKIRISISACPNACTSPLLNEIGIVGQNRPVRVPGLCTGCGTCVEYCKEEAITIKRGISVLDTSRCVQCGTCVRSCPYNLLQSSGEHYLITVGGRRGRHPKTGRELITVKSQASVLLVVEKVVAWVYRRAWSGRLLSDQMDEIQFEKFRDEIKALIPEDERIGDTSGEISAGSGI